MKEVFFNIDSYSLSNKVENLLKYLKKQEIEYVIKDNMIEFYIYLGKKRVWCEAHIYKKFISGYVLHSKCDEKESERLKDYISLCFPRKYLKDDNDFIYFKSYPQNCYYFEMILSNDVDFNLVVKFLNEKNKPYKYNVSNDKGYIIGLIIEIVIGLALTVLFMYQYNKINDFNTNIITAVISVVFMVLSILIILLMEKIKILKSILWSLLVPIIYAVVVFVVLVLIALSNGGLDLEITLKLLMWTIYSMPSFLLVVGLLVLFMIGG